MADPADLENIARLHEAYCRVLDKSVEPHPGFRLAFIEFHESGLAREDQVKHAIDSIQQSGENTVVVLFVHGWGHSADVLDEYVIGFRSALSDIRQALPADQSIVGIYIGWPAKRLLGPLHYLTFKGRDDAANEVSTTGATKAVLQELQLTIEKLRAAGRDVAAISVGHSLGGKFLFTPMQERLECLDSRCSEDFPVEELPLATLPSFGDLVLLLNPAQDINDYTVFEKYAKTYSERFRDYRRPTIVTLSSEADGTMRTIFRIGRTYKTLQYRSRWGEGFWEETIGLGWGDQEKNTHTLCLAGRDAPRDGACDDPSWCSEPIVSPCGETELRRCRQGGPFMLVRVDGRIVKKHGDVFNHTFVSFLRAFVVQQIKGQGITEEAACSQASAGPFGPSAQSEQIEKQRFHPRDCDRYLKSK